MSRQKDDIEQKISRVWLNEKRGRAFTIVVTDFNKTNPPQWNNPSIDAYIDIGDCSQSVSLDFSIDDLKNKTEIAKVKRKMARFRNEFKKLEDAVLDAIEKAKDIPAFVRKPKDKK